MTRLAATADWPPGAVADRRRFLDTCAARAGELSVRFGPRRPAPGAGAAESFRGPAASEGEAREALGIPELHSEAAELAFVTGDTLTGLRQLDLAAPTGRYPFPTATVAARSMLFWGIGNSAHLWIQGPGLTRRPGVEEPPLVWARLGPTQQIAWALPVMVLGTLASGLSRELPPVLFEPGDRPVLRPAWLAALATQEFALLGFFDLSRYGIAFRRDGSVLAHFHAMAALIEMERVYDERIRLLASDRFHWEEVRPRAELIDWRLLAIHLALIRRDRLEAVRLQSPTGPAAAFIRELAREIAAATGREEGRRG